MTDDELEVERERGSWEFEALRDAQLNKLIDEAKAEARTAMRTAHTAGLMALISGVVAVGALVAVVVRI